MSNESNRRSFLKMGTIATSGLILGSAAKAIAQTCGLTPRQTAGPFYPGESEFSQQNDLTYVSNSWKRAIGQVVYIKGKVLNQNCTPISNANVEIWQACATGKYNHSNDPNPAKLDPNFKYWGETFTDDLGQYSFKTIIPGAYPADTNWTRPPHIHFRIAKLGYIELITQMYFKGNEFNDADLILQQIGNEKNSVIIDFQEAPSDLEQGSLIGYFDITLKSVR